MKTKSQTRESTSVTISLLLELCEIVMTACVVHAFMGDRPAENEDPILMHGDTTSAVSWVNPCGVSRDRCAGLTMRTLGRMKIASG